MDFISAILNLFRRNRDKQANATAPRHGVGAVQLLSARQQGRFSREFVPPDVDLERIDNIYQNEAFARRALDKHIELMFKAGWDLIGDDEKTVEYIRKRLFLIAEMTGIPTNQLFVEIAEDLVKYSNAVVIKVRNKKKLYPGNIRVSGINNKPPICGYFPINLHYVETERDAAGNVYRWRITFPGANKPLILPKEDVIHFYYRRDKNKVFATPYLIAVVEDINALRQMEEGVLKQVYRNLYPFLHHIVGLEKDGYGGTEDEVNQVRNLIENMDLEAGLVTTERHKITPIALDQVIDAYNYLRYFEQRVFTGLGVSETVMGRSGSASRATAESQYFDLRETVKALQRVMESFVNEFIIKELLLEGGYDALFHPESNVSFRFREIDLDMKIKHENHVIYQYITNCITEDELRSELGRNPITDRGKLFYNLVTIPVAQATGNKDAASPSPPRGGNGSSESESRKTDPPLQTKLSEILLEICHHVTSLYHDDIEAAEIIAATNREAVRQIMLGAEVNIPTLVESIVARSKTSNGVRKEDVKT